MELKQLITKQVIINILWNIFGGMLLAFGLYNIHSLSNVTEGGILGLTLLLQHWFNISPAVTSFIMNAVCYAIGLKVLGKGFIGYSIFAGGAFSLGYAIFEMFPPLYPKIAEMPFVAAIVGAIFVGVSVGICIRFGGAPTGDDALAMSIRKKTKLDIKWAYLISDLTVLLLSLSYLNIKQVGLSLITVILSGQILSFVDKVGKKENKEENNEVRN